MPEQIAAKYFNKKSAEPAEILARHSGRNSKERPRRCTVSDGSIETTGYERNGRIK